MNKIKRTTDIIYNEYTKRDLTIIHISDIHFNKFTSTNKLTKIKEEIYKNNPDYVLITGDIIDSPAVIKDKNQIKKLLFFLTDIGSFTKVLISLGNHDIFSNKDFKFFNNLDDLKNIYVLNNTSYTDEYIYISGITLPTSYYYNILHDESSVVLLETLNKNKKLITNLGATIPKVCLIHSSIKIPEVINEFKEYDLILSGHTHGGMVPNILSPCFKKNSGIIAPNKTFFPSIARGKIEKYLNNHKITIIISSGITKLSSKSSKILCKLNFVYNMDINKIIITKKRGKYYG